MAIRSRASLLLSTRGLSSLHFSLSKDSSLRSFLLVLFLARAAAGAVYVLPVATAKYHERYYSTTLFLHNPTGAAVRCESVYAIPNDPKGGTLRGTYELPPRTTQVEERTLQEAGAIGTLRVDCTDEVLLAALVQTSTDGRTFDGGRIFRGVGEDHPITADAPRRVATAADLLLMEVGGAPVAVHARVLDATGNVLAERSYEIPAFAQQIVNLSELRTTATHVEVMVRGNGAVVAEPEGAAAAIRLVASSVRPQATSPARPVNPLRGFPASFKGAPFQDPATGLIQMRDRWYDPSTGTFMSPDPDGSADSANLYLFCKGDPVNNSDPTGRHTFVKRQVNGLEFELLAPDPAEVRQGILGMSGSFVNPLTGKREAFAWDQHASELLLMQARWGNPLMQDAFAQFFGMTHDQVDVSGLRLYWNSLGHHKTDIALSAGFTLAMLAPRSPVPAPPQASTAPRVNLINRTPLSSRLARAAGIPDSAAFAQTTYSSAFSTEGRFAGMTVDEVTAGLRAGRLTPVDVRVDYIVRDGNTLILNTRSAQALQNAGIPRSLWVGVDRTGVAQYEAMVSSQLNRNRLTSAGTPTVRPARSRKP